MAKFMVSAEARFEWELEAEDEELSIAEAVRLFDEAYDGNPVSLFKWEATDTTDNRPI